MNLFKINAFSAVLDTFSDISSDIEQRLKCLSSYNVITYTQIGTFKYR